MASWFHNKNNRVRTNRTQGKECVSSWCIRRVLLTVRGFVAARLTTSYVFRKFVFFFTFRRFETTHYRGLIARFSVHGRAVRVNYVCWRRRARRAAIKHRTYDTVPRRTRAVVRSRDTEMIRHSTLMYAADDVRVLYVCACTRSRYKIIN